jgi:hypothetical protein
VDSAGTALLSKQFIPLLPSKSRSVRIAANANRAKPW